MFSHTIVLVLLIGFASSLTTFEENTIFYGFNSEALPTSPFVSDFNSSITKQCNPNKNFTLIVPSWRESFQSPWVTPMIKNFLYYRGGCVFVMDYSYYSNTTDYFNLVKKFSNLTSVLTKKLQQIGNYDRQLCFGFSFGARQCIAAGKALATQTIGRMELCDPAGPGFNINEDPKPAAKNVACINTSTDKGTSVYNCHQNFRMGQCGRSQPGAGKPPLGDQGLCPYFYNLAFNYNFVPNNYHKCYSRRLAKLTSDVKMGYNAVFDRRAVQGDIMIATAKYVPYVVENGKIDNVMTPLTEFMDNGPQSDIEFNMPRRMG